MSILVCGEAIVDLFVSVDDGTMQAQPVLGGSPYNVAIGLARLGVTTSFFGGLSSDVFGAAIRSRLIAEGISVAHAVETDRLTTISVVGTDTNGHPAYAFHGEGKADRSIGVADLPRELDKDIRAMVMGSYTLAVEPVASAHLALARREMGKRLISIDPNLRPTVTPDIADWRQRFAAFLPCADIIKASDEDIGIAFPGLPHREVTANWFAAGAKLCIITRGAEGAVAWRPGRDPIVEAGRPVETVDTVGAGDSFHAALLARLDRYGLLSREGVAALDDAHLADVLDFAVTTAAITCSRRGADPPRLAEMPPDPPAAGTFP
ncbi:carbohydrate kinase family protein [Bosea thiooxidans]|nr:carbohydrate kinase [Bosea sp. (in: a-proteobacteria)]